jgi:Fur family transcriptional regulator, ferric uptake regulator
MNVTKAINSCELVATGLCTHDPSCEPVATDSANSSGCPFERRTLLDELANKGIRLTLQRRVLVEIIQTADQHLDAASLLQLARKKEPNIDRATVYRTIELLKKLRLIDELDLMHLQGEKHYYEVKTRRDHVHLACFQCGRIEEFSSVLYEQLKTEIASQASFELRVARLEIGGRCRACRGQAIESAPQRELLAVNM